MTTISLMSQQASIYHQRKVLNAPLLHCPTFSPPSHLEPYKRNDELELLMGISFFLFLF